MISHIKKKMIFLQNNFKLKKKKMKKVLLITSTFCIINLSAQKTAYIEQSTLLKSLNGYEKNSKHVDSIKQVYILEIKNLEKKLNEKVQVLFKNYSVSENDNNESIKAKLSELDKSKFELYQEESKLIEKTTKNHEIFLNGLYNEKVQPLLDKLNKNIETYAKANKIDTVFIIENLGSALAYIDKSKNITEEIKKTLK